LAVHWENHLSQFVRNVVVIWTGNSKSRPKINFVWFRIRLNDCNVSELSWNNCQKSRQSEWSLIVWNCWTMIEARFESVSHQQHTNFKEDGHPQGERWRWSRSIVLYNWIVCGLAVDLIWFGIFWYERNCRINQSQ
jgi:hypothetical protein